VTRARRPASLFFRAEETAVVHLARLLEGEIDVSPGGRLLALSPLTGVEQAISVEELRLLLATPESKWADVAEDDAPAVADLAERGLIMIDAGGTSPAELARNDSLATYWHPHAALFHAMTKWRDVEIAMPSEAPAVSMQPAAEVDAAPPAFAGDATGTAYQLPFDPRADGIFGTLALRRTTRGFDREAPMTREQLSTLLYEVYGCRGTVEVDGEHVALKRSSPSGGGLHPTEVYPLLLRVEGFEPGLYHYRTRDHALVPVVATTLEQAASLASELTCGQSFLEAAGALFVMTARFRRSFWKYRRHERAYTTLLLDAGHLSQTQYLVATALGLGAFVTAAINGANAEEVLGLDPLEEGAIAICACGNPAAEPFWLDARFEPYTPSR
jgi:putative peptide maturation dehydrogenase